MNSFAAWFLLVSSVVLVGFLGYGLLLRRKPKEKTLKEEVQNLSDQLGNDEIALVFLCDPEPIEEADPKKDEERFLKDLDTSRYEQIDDDD